MKKFFKDVIEAIKNPAEDGEKTFEVIRKILRLASLLSIFFVFVFTIMDAASYIFAQNKESMKSLIEYKGMFRFIFSYVSNIVLIIKDTILFVLFTKAIKRKIFFDRKLIIFLFVAMVAWPLVRQIILQESITYILWALVVSLLYTYVYINAIVKFKSKEKRKNNFSEKQIRIRNITVLYYCIFIVSYFRQGIGFFPYIYGLFEPMMAAISENNIYNFFYILGLFFYSLSFIILVAIIILLFVSRYKYITKILKSINVLFLILIVFNVLTVAMIYNLTVISIEAAILIIAASYQNKYRVFDNLGTRMFKSSYRKSKEWFNNYLSFKEK